MKPVVVEKDFVLQRLYMRDMLKKPAVEFLLKDSNSIYTVHAIAYIDLLRDEVLYSIDDEASYKLCNFDVFFNVLGAIPI